VPKDRHGSLLAVRKRLALMELVRVHARRLEGSGGGARYQGQYRMHLSGNMIAEAEGVWHETRSISRNASQNTDVSIFCPQSYTRRCSCSSGGSHELNPLTILSYS
jgi:hypothetical protein